VSEAKALQSSAGRARDRSEQVGYFRLKVGQRAAETERER